MKNTKVILTHFLLFSVILLPNILFADSPLTSTPFYKGYMNVDIVLRAEQSGVMDKEFAEYLHDPTNSIDVKAAVINALGWSVDGKGNSGIYEQQIFNRAVIEDDIPQLSGTDQFVIGYLKAMDNYNKPDAALAYIKTAIITLDQSFTVAMIDALVRAQKDMETNFCDAWNHVNNVYLNSSLIQDMNKDAQKIIYDYMVEYKSSCTDN